MSLRSYTPNEVVIRSALIQRRLEIFRSLEDAGWRIVSESDYSKTYGLYMRFRLRRGPEPHPDYYPLIDISLAVSVPPNSQDTYKILSEIRLTECEEVPSSP